MLPRKKLVKFGSRGIGSSAGGGALLLLAALPGPLSFIFGGIMAILGLGMSRSKEDKTAGWVTATAGVMTFLTGFRPFQHGLINGLLVASGIGLLVYGGYNLFKFLKNYKKRV